MEVDICTGMLLKKNWLFESWTLLGLNILMILSGCDFLGIGQPDDPLYDPNNTSTCRYIDYDHSTQTGIRIMYYESGKKKSYAYFDKGRRDSLFRAWYENGNKKLVIWYDKGMKQGLYQKYRKTGELYREIEYVNDLKNGSYTEFWKNGNVKYTLDYENDLPVNSTLKEYSSKGDKKGKHLIITEKNTVRKDGKYRLYVYFKDKPKESLYLARVDNVAMPLEKVDNMGYIEMDVPPNVSIMKKVLFEGYYEGKKSTVQSVKRSFNIGIDNF